MEERQSHTKVQGRPYTKVQGRCPACYEAVLFLGEGGYVTCSWIDCPEPDAAAQLLARAGRMDRPPLDPMPPTAAQRARAGRA